MNNIFLLLLLFISSLIFAQSKDQIEIIIAKSNTQNLIDFSIKSQENLKVSKKKALELGYAEYIKLEDGRTAQLQRLDVFNKPVYYVTKNVGAAATARANRLNTGGSLGLNLNGQNMIVGIWDGGAIRQSHEKVIGRVTQKDNAVFTDATDGSNHALHVAGTMMGGTNGAANAKGIAYEAQLWANDWNDDDTEMAQQAAQGLLLSNHSYGVAAFDGYTLLINKLWFGKYEQGSKNWDEIMYNAPYYLAIDAAGNDRNKAISATNKGGYDMLLINSLTKNGICVGGTNEVLNYTGPSSVTSYNLSNWGGADDGRIKPDISTKAINVFSSTSISNISYDTYTGTSMASPGITGSLTLLQQFYSEKYGSFMRSSTVKGLALHTADEAGGNPGPDFKFGWGLINAEKAAIAIRDRGLNSMIEEFEITNEGSCTIQVDADPTKTLMASICWTDPAGEVFTSPNEAELLDNPIPSLVNDMDIRVTQNATVIYPWKLQPPLTTSAAAAAAIKGDNLVDTMEKVEVLNPSGSYTITVNHKGTLRNNKQVVSLVVTGVLAQFAINSTNGNNKAVCAPNNAQYNFEFLSGNGYSGNTSLSVQDIPVGANAVLSQTSIAANGSFNLTVSNLQNVTPGIYTLKIAATNAGNTKYKDLVLWVLHNTFSILNLSTPIDNSIGQVRPVTLNWDSNPNAQTYTVQLATDVAFNSIIGTKTTTINTINSETMGQLQDNTTYYWRVKPTNNCSEGAYSGIYNFKTANFTCSSFIDTDVVTIPTTPSETFYLSTQNITATETIDRVMLGLDITHTWVGDLNIDLVSPQGAEVRLHSSGTCSGNGLQNFNVIYSDFGTDLVCSATPPAIAGTVKPKENLGEFNGQNPAGIWTLKVQDPYNNDGGTLNNWNLILCKNISLSIVEKELGNITFGPNPTSDKLFFEVESDQNEELEIELYDIRGRILKIDSFPNSSQFSGSINFENYQSGVYLLKFKLGNLSKTLKISKI